MELRNLYTILQVISVAILAFELFYILGQKPSKLQRDLIIVCVSLIFASVAYAIELQAQSLETAIIGCKLGYLGKPFAFIAALYLLFDYAHIHVNKLITSIIIAYFAILTLFVFTNGISINGVVIHNLYYPTVEYNPSRLGSPLNITHGPIWYVYMISSFILYLAFVIVIVYEFRFAKNAQVKKMTAWLFFMVFFCILGLLLFILGVTNGYDSTLFGVLIGSLIMIYLFSKYHIFESLTLAKEETINDAENQMIVLDAKLNISYFSKNAYIFAPELKEFLTHKKENIIINRLNQYDTNKPIFLGDKVYKLSIKEYYNKSNTIIYGKSYMFYNITDEYLYQQRLKEDVDNATKEVVKMHKDLLLSIAKIIEARDGCTGEHIKNVSKYAVGIAIELSKNPKYKDIITDGFISRLQDTIPLHDIGKIKIPDAILKKHSKLTKNEFEIIKTHTILGAELIKDGISGESKKQEVEMAYEIALYHHERVDGKGYPKGLVGDQIPLSAKIASVADVYDALRMKRAYKEPFSKAKSIQTIIDDKGTRFDNDVVDAFLKIVDNIDLD